MIFWLMELLYKLRLKKRPESGTIAHALREFKAAGYTGDKEGPNKWIKENVIELLTVFASQGHSGSSAPWCVEIFRKLALHEPLAPLQGTDDEWMEVGEGMWQNIRCGHVFKDATGQAYDIDGRVFREPNGMCYTSRDSRVAVTFPYTPTSEYIDVPASEGGEGQESPS